MEEKSTRDHQKLRHLQRYFDTNTCRHHFILNYFGDPTNSTVCNTCDNCHTPPDADLRPPTEDEWTLLQKILSCIARMEGRYGRTRIAQVLTGANTKPIREAHLDRLTTYGILKDLDTKQILLLIDALQKADCVQPTPNEYPTLEITSLGQNVMQRNADITLNWPDYKKPNTTTSSTPIDDYDPDLYNTLKTWRNQTAIKQELPAYLILNNRALQSFATIKPTTLDQLQTVHGLGPAKIARYGQELLDLFN